MGSLNVRPLRDDLPFGARISGVTEGNLRDEAVRAQIRDAFEERGMIVFEDLDPSSRLQVDISTVFGPLKDHPVKTVVRVDRDALPGVIEMKPNPKTTAIVEVNGKRLMAWQPWHFDHCYNNELNRAGVLRALTIPPADGLTGFVDGIELYNAISPELRQKIEGKNIIYTLDLLYAHMRFGVPKGFRELQKPVTDILEVAKTMPRAIHPAVWTRESGEKVMHVSPWMAVGIEGHEDPRGDELLESVCQDILAKVHPYYHSWKLSEMVVWDNWRMLHHASGISPDAKRCMHRTTIKGDYGLGYWEKGGKSPVAEMAEMM
jgi:taurine dioxygenase